MRPLRIDLGNQRWSPLFISPDSQRLFARSDYAYYGALKVCTLQVEEAPEVIEDGKCQIRDAALLMRERPSGQVGADAEQTVAVLLASGLVKLIDVKTYAVVDDNFLGVGDHANRLASSSDGNRIAIGYTSPPGNVQVTVFDLRTRTREQELNGAKRWDYCSQILFSPDGKHVVAVSDDWLAVWDVGGKLVKQVDTRGVYGSSYWTVVAVTPDSTKLVWLENSGKDTPDSVVRMQDLVSHKNEDVRRWEFPGSTQLRALDISPDGRRVILGGRLQTRGPDELCEWPLDAPDGLIKDHASLSMIAELQGVDFARVAPNGRKIVAAGVTLREDKLTSNHFIAVWDYPRRYIL